MTLAAVPEDARYEVKFVAHATRLHELLRWARIHPAGFLEAYPQRQVNNVYFDNNEFHAYRENLLGSNERSKLRLRWYGATNRPESGMLEVKRRRSGLGWKLSFPVAALPLEGVPWSEFRGELRSQLSPLARLWLDANGVEVLINRYQRRYFVSSDGLVRLTFDWDQQVYDQRRSTLPNLERRANLPNSVVVEFKFAKDDRQDASRIIQGLPLRVSRNSKYVIGMQAIARG